MIHTVGPVWQGRERDDLAELLRDCYLNSIRVADELDATSVAFPLISAGAYGWPVDDAIRQALTVLRAARPQRVAEARLVLFTAQTHALAERILRDEFQV